MTPVVALLPHTVYYWLLVGWKISKIVGNHDSSRWFRHGRNLCRGESIDDACMAVLLTWNRSHVFGQGKRKMVDGFVRWCKRGKVGLNQITTVKEVIEESPTGLYDGFYAKTHWKLNATGGMNANDDKPSLCFIERLMFLFIILVVFFVVAPS
jgi:hypothetical protein